MLYFNVTFQVPHAQHPLHRHHERTDSNIPPMEDTSARHASVEDIREPAVGRNAVRLELERQQVDYQQQQQQQQEAQQQEEQQQEAQQQEAQQQEEQRRVEEERGQQKGREQQEQEQRQEEQRQQEQRQQEHLRRNGTSPRQRALCSIRQRETGRLCTACP